MCTHTHTHTGDRLRCGCGRERERRWRLEHTKLVSMREGEEKRREGQSVSPESKIEASLVPWLDTATTATSHNSICWVCLPFFFCCVYLFKAGDGNRTRNNTKKKKNKGQRTKGVDWMRVWRLFGRL
jgi:hypothetical protein